MSRCSPSWVATPRPKGAVQSRPLIVLLAGLIQALPAQAVEADLGGPRQHQRAAAAVAIDALETEVLEHGLAAAGADGLGGERVGVLHHGVLGRIGAQHLLLGG